MRALEKSASKAAGVNRSISPKYYDNCMGYAPRTVRLFSLATKTPANQDYDSTERIKINGKMRKVDKDNIFKTLANKKKR